MITVVTKTKQAPLLGSSKCFYVLRDKMNADQKNLAKIAKQFDSLRIQLAELRQIKNNKFRMHVFQLLRNSTLERVQREKFDKKIDEYVRCCMFAIFNEEHEKLISLGMRW